MRVLATPRGIAAVSAVAGAVLGLGLELCFGEGRYRLIMLMGAAGGGMIGALTWLGRAAWERAGARRDRLVRTVLHASVPGTAVFVLWFLWRVLPLIREEMKYSLP